MNFEENMLDIFDALSVEERAGVLFGLNLYLTVKGKTPIVRNVAANETEPEPEQRVVVKPEHKTAVANDYTFTRLSAETLERFRRAFVRRVWEYGLRSELVTRVVWLFDQGLLKGGELDQIVKTAESEFRENEKPRWKTLGSAIKQIYVKNNLNWTPTAADLEPKPDGFDENNRTPRRIPITQRLDPDYNPEREDRTPAAFRAFHSNDAVSSAVASVGHDVAAFDPATTGGVK